MDILIDPSAGALPDSKDVLDDLRQGEPGKFILSANRPEQLILFPKRLQHIEVARMKLRELHLPGFHGAGVIKASVEEEDVAPRIAILYDSMSFLLEYGFDRPREDEIARELLQEAKKSLADFLQSIGWTSEG